MLKCDSRGKGFKSALSIAMSVILAVSLSIPVSAIAPREAHAAGETVMLTAGQVNGAYAKVSDGVTAGKVGEVAAGGGPVQPYSHEQSFDKIRMYSSFDSQEYIFPLYYSDALFYGNPQEYNQHLGTASWAFAVASSYLNKDEEATEDGNVSYNKHAAGRQFLADIGCPDDRIYVNYYNTTVPTANSIGVTIGSKDLTYTGGGKTGDTLVAIAVRGINYDMEWVSNVTLGPSGEAEGFSQAATTVYNEVRDYLSSYGLMDSYKNGHVKFWITGFSRAGATANITAKRLVEMINTDCTGDEESELFAYTCEAPRGGVDAAEQLTDKTEYFCIHNMVNKADLVPLVGPEQMGFKRYGVDHYIPGTTYENYNGGMLPYDYHDFPRLQIQDGYYQIYQFQREAKKAASDDKTVTSYVDNAYVSTKTQLYNQQRAKMFEQLSAMDPSFSFDDTFKPYAMDFVPSVKTYVKGYEDWRNTEETFIEDLINFAQVGYRGKWTSKSNDPSYVVVPSRNYYVRNGVQGLAQFYMRMAYGPGGFALDVSMDSIGLPMVPSFWDVGLDIFSFLKEPSMVTLYLDCVRGWDELSDSKKRSWADTLWDNMNKNGSFAKLTDDQVAGLRVRWDDLVDRAFTFVNSDYQAASPFCGALSPGYKPYTYSYTAYDASGNSLEGKQANWRAGFDDESMMYLPTFLENANYIMSCHDKVLNMAWARSYDSWYDGETTHYKLERPATVSAPTAYAIDEKTGKKTELVAGEDEVNAFTSAQRVYFEGNDTAGEAIYYSYDGADGSKAQTLFDGASVDFRPSSTDLSATSWTASAFAMSYGVRSEKATYNITMYDDKHAISVIGPYDERTIIAKEGEQVTISLPEDAPDTAYFSSWTVESYDDHMDGNWEFLGDVTDELGVSVSAAGNKLSFTMPKSGGESSPYGYRLRLTYDYKQGIDQVSIDIPKPVEGQTLAENASVTFPGGTVASYPIDWKYLHTYHPEGTLDWVTRTEYAYATGGDKVYQQTEYFAEVKIPKNTANGIAFAEFVKASLTGGGVHDENGYYQEGESGGSAEAMLKRLSWNGSVIACVQFDKTGTDGGGAKPSTRFGLEVVPFDLNVEQQDGESTVYLVEQGKSITVTAPAVEKEQFVYWESDDGVDFADKYAQTTTLTIPDSLPVDTKLTVRACYVPMITELNAQIQAPVAGEALPTTTGTLGVTVLNGFELHPDCVQVSWLPSAEETSGTAAYLTQYTAAIKLAPLHDDEGDYILVKQVADAEGNPVEGAAFERQNAFFVYSDDLEVSSSAESEEASARIVETTFDTSTNTMYITFAAQNYQLSSVQALEPVFGAPHGATAEQIQALLPDSTVIKTTSGLRMDAEIEWTNLAPESVDDARSAIMWTARGILTLPDGVDDPDSDRREIPIMDTVFVNEADRAVPPTTSLGSGMYFTDQVVTLSSSEENGITYYTIDGTEPTTDSPVYNGEEIVVSRDAPYLEDEMTYQEIEGEVEDGEDAKTGEWIPTGRKMFVLKAYTVVDGKWDSDPIVCQYVFDNAVPVPKAADHTYNGSAQIGVSAGEHYTVKSVSGSGTVDKTGNAVATNAGTYKVVLKIADGFVWQLDEKEGSDPKTTTDDQALEFTIAPASIAQAKITVLEDPATLTNGKAEPAVKVTLGGKELPSDAYDVVYAKNTAAGTASVKVVGKGNYTGTSKPASFTVAASDEPGGDTPGGDTPGGDTPGGDTPGGDEPGPGPVVDAAWTRLYGDNAFETMDAVITAGGFEKGGTVVLASLEGYWDALTAAGIAGLEGAPVVMSLPEGLSPEANAQLKALAPEKVVVCGGTYWLPDALLAEVAQVTGLDSGAVVRLAGDNALLTAGQIAGAGKGRWSDTAILATVGTFQDALAAAPVSWAKAMPIFLAQFDFAAERGYVTPETIASMKDAGITKCYIAGGTYWIPEQVSEDLASAGIEVLGQLMGDTAVETSAAIAEMATSKLGMSAHDLGVANVAQHYDALASAAFCGKRGSVLLLALDERSSIVGGFVKSNASTIGHGYVFGGTASVSEATMSALKAATK